MRNRILKNPFQLLFQFQFNPLRSSPVSRADRAVAALMALALVGTVGCQQKCQPPSTEPLTTLSETSWRLIETNDTQVVNADIERMQQAGIHPGATGEGLRFARTHKLSESLYKWEMMGAALLILLTPFVPHKP